MYESNINMSELGIPSSGPTPCEAIVGLNFDQGIITGAAIHGSGCSARVNDDPYIGILVQFQGKRVEIAIHLRSNEGPNTFPCESIAYGSRSLCIISCRQITATSGRRWTRD